MGDFDPETPSIARVYDYLLGGKDNFAVDRQLADQLIEAIPLTVKLARENRQFLARAVTWTASQGISQFIDLGCGMPTVPNTHETARAVTAGARVAYVDNDVVVLNHLNVRVAKGDPGVTVVDGDLRETDKTLDAVAAGIDLAAPVCLILGYQVHFFSADAARDLVARYAAALASDSYVVLSAGRAEGEMAAQGFSAYSAGGTQVYNHSVAEFASFFGSLVLVPPGVVDAREWRPDLELPGPLPFRGAQAIVGVARVG